MFSSNKRATLHDQRLQIYTPFRVLCHSNRDQYQKETAPEPECQLSMSLSLERLCTAVQDISLSCAPQRITAVWERQKWRTDTRFSTVSASSRFCNSSNEELLYGICKHNYFKKATFYKKTSIL